MDVDPRRQAIQEIVRSGVAAGQHVSYQVISGSMAPFIRIGDQVYLRQVAVKDLRPGDVVSFAAQDGGYVTHRYLGRAKRRDDLLLARGDRASMTDPPWPAGSLLGRVEAISRQGQQLDLCHGIGRLIYRGVGRVFVTEWCLLGPTRRFVVARVLHRALLVWVQLIMWLAWRSPYVIICSQPDFRANDD